MGKKILNEYEHYLNYSINLCNRYVYSSFKLRKKLKSKNVSTSTINRILITLVKYNLINDKTLIKDLSNEMILKYYGLNRIRDRLIKMGFPQTQIESTMIELNKVEIENKLLEYINKKCPKDLPNIKKMNNFINQCLRRGYDINDIKYYLINRYNNREEDI